MLKLFVCSYIQLLLLAILSRLVNREQYVGVFIVSSIVGLTHFMIFQEMMKMSNDWYSIASYAIGGAFGNLSGAWLHHRFSKKEIQK